MNVNRRDFLGGSLAAAAAIGPLGTIASSAHASPQARAAERSTFDLALVDAKNGVVENVNTGDIRKGTFGRPWARFDTGGWAPLEFRRRKVKGVGLVFMLCGAHLNGKNGQVTIHREGTSEGIGADHGLTIFPHCMEYLPTADAVIVVGTRGREDAGPVPPGARRGGSYQLYTAPDGTPGSFKRVGTPQPFRQAHAVLWDPLRQLLWIYGGNRLQAFKVEGRGTSTKLTEVPGMNLVSRVLENGHDLQPDYVDTRFFWATGSHYMFKIYKAGDRPSISWSHRVREVKSFSRHESGRGIWTTSRDVDNPYGDNKVHFMWPNETVRHSDRSKWIYKARLLNHELPGA
ncbi:twin-arginine translocation signal domain-containing protein [Streptomyces sp. SAJ15]|uniref:twin-arginine translocation signal domain-containing protein n=1 Tax=Streptomyces sp. SAJ15 TaxID=2011095 RepID=UPI0011868611|nr:twin-arginine translocation signal domain-containing protein [Streptomyces sp. SAJ15]TVL90317.1 hypothetical protein CD790_22695 [Streptomyces sp. SAJ15]